MDITGTTMRLKDKLTLLTMKKFGVARRSGALGRPPKEQNDAYIDSNSWCNTSFPVILYSQSGPDLTFFLPRAKYEICALLLSTEYKICYIILYLILLYKINCEVIYHNSIPLYYTTVNCYTYVQCTSYSLKKKSKEKKMGNQKKNRRY